MSEETTMIYDDGYYFGLGAFETIAVEDGVALFAEEHYHRLKEALDFFGISVPSEASLKQICQEAEKNGEGKSALKLAVSAENVVYSRRKNPYSPKDYERGFQVTISRTYRNETSPLVCRKTLNTGELILEKRRAMREGFDEVLFGNSKGELTEGATTNVFLVREGKLFTPPVSSGLLPGILRGHILEKYQVEEHLLFLEEIPFFDEMFLTNSLMGVMPVCRVGNYMFSSRSTAEQLEREYRKAVEAKKWKHRRKIELIF